MKKTSFWFLTLCALVACAIVNGWNNFIRIAIISNAIVVLMEILAYFLKNDKNEEESE